MKTHVTINGKEVLLIQKRVQFDGHSTFEIELNEEQHKVNELLLALDGLSFGKKEETLGKCPCGGVNGKNHPHAGTNFKEGDGRCTRCGNLFDKIKEQKPFSVENPPEEGEDYWYVENDARYGFDISLASYYEDGVFLSQNNCFRTKEEAEAALKRVLQALKS